MSTLPVRKPRVKRVPTPEEIKAMCLDKQKECEQDIDDAKHDQALLKPLNLNFKIVNELLEDALQDAEDELAEVLESMQELEQQKAQN
jgi:flagellar motility protein MotE (MotC chaperone)